MRVLIGDRADARRHPRHYGCQIHPAHRGRRLRKARSDDSHARRSEALHVDRDSQRRGPGSRHHDPHALQRGGPHHAKPLDPDARHASARRRGLCRRWLHPHLPGRARQVRVGRGVPDDTAPARTAQSHGRRSLHRRLRHDRMAAEESPRIEWPDRHARKLLRGLYRGDGACESPSGAQGRSAHEPDDRRLDGR